MVVYMEREPMVEKKAKTKIKSNKKEEEKPKLNESNMRVLVLGTDGNNISIVDNQLTPLEIQSVILNLGKEFGLFEVVKK